MQEPQSHQEIIINEVTPLPIGDPPAGNFFTREKFTAPPTKIGKLCPVCGGKGIVPGDFYSINGDLSTTNVKYPVPCRGCDGSGVI